MHLRRLFFPLAILVLAVACAATGVVLPRPSERDAAELGVPLDELRRGRRLYAKKCGACHMLYPPSRYSMEEWEAILESMADKIHVSREENELMRGYLSIFAADAPADTPE